MTCTIPVNLALVFLCGHDVTNQSFLLDPDNTKNWIIFLGWFQLESTEG